MTRLGYGIYILKVFLYKKILLHLPGYCHGQQLYFQLDLSVWLSSDMLLAVPRVCTGPNPSILFSQRASKGQSMVHVSGAEIDGFNILAGMYTTPKVRLIIVL